MGPLLLILAALALLSGCGSAGEAESGHDALACQACHLGPPGYGAIASVPVSGCIAAGCHVDHGPARRRLGSVSFAHRDHGEGGDVPLECAGCHRHGSGRADLVASLDTCVLCHAPDVTGDDPACRTCHVDPTHVRFTSQGAPVPHDRFADLEIPCSRCHYDVLEPTGGVDPDRCGNCHASPSQPAGFDPHADHTAMSCLRCHEADQHRVVRMSTSVALSCGECHLADHGYDFTWSAPVLGCQGCHEGVHREQQAYFLGTLPADEALAAPKFLAGLNCSSCHAPTHRDARPTAAACTDCHGADYAPVLDMWQAGIDQRLRAVRAYRDQVQRLLPTARAEIADQRLWWIDTAGGHHNLELTHRLLEEAVESLRAACARAGVASPTAPDLGARPRAGMCGHCHYDQRGPWDLGNMDDALHARFAEEARR